jgi:cytochrome c oxidase subunit I
VVNPHLWIWIIGAVLNAYAMGMAGSQGMLRRTIYEPGMYEGYVAVALVGGVLMGVGLVLFLVNVIATLGLAEVVGLFVPDRWRKERTPSPAGA